MPSTKEHKVIVVSTVTSMFTDSFSGKTAEMSLIEDSMEQREREREREQEQGEEREQEEKEKLTSNQRHYARHREEKLRKVKERYHSRPDVMARDAVRAEKREERARLAAERAVRRVEREKRLKERFEHFKSSDGTSPVLEKE